MGADILNISPAMLNLIWLGLFILLLVIEIITVGLTTIWFAAGALAALGRGAGRAGGKCPGGESYHSDHHLSGGFRCSAYLYPAVGREASQQKTGQNKL